MTPVAVTSFAAAFRLVPAWFWPVLVWSMLRIWPDIRAALWAGHTHALIWVWPDGWLALEVCDPPAASTAHAPSLPPQRRRLIAALAGDTGSPDRPRADAPCPDRGARPGAARPADPLPAADTS